MAAAKESGKLFSPDRERLRTGCLKRGGATEFAEFQAAETARIYEAELSAAD